MRVNEIVKPVEEGVNDPHIFKAVFLAGGPGSGKSFVANKMLKGTGLKTVNSDDVFEFLMNKHGLDMSDPDVIASDRVQDPDPKKGLRAKAKDMTDKRMKGKDGDGGYLQGRLGLIIDGTGKDVNKVSKTNEELKALGYETMMLFVNTSEDVAQERNAKRARSLPTKMVKDMWNTVQQNLMKFQQVFGASNFHVVDNSGGLEDPERKENFLEVTRAIDKFLMKAPSSRFAKQWIASQKK